MSSKTQASHTEIPGYANIKYDRNGRVKEKCLLF